MWIKCGVGMYSRADDGDGKDVDDDDDDTRTQQIKFK